MSNIYVLASRGEVAEMFSRLLLLTYFFFLFMKAEVDEFLFVVYVLCCYIVLDLMYIVF